MIPAQLIRAATQLARLCGLVEVHRELVALEERATLDDVLELLDACAEAVDRQRPAAERAARPRRAGVGGWNATAPDVEDRVVGLLRAGWAPEDIAAEPGMPAARTIRTIRARHKIPAPSRKRKGPPRWEAPIRAAHRRRLTVPEIAEATGYRETSVRQYLSLLGLRARRATDVEELE